MPSSAGFLGSVRTCGNRCINVQQKVSARQSILHTMRPGHPGVLSQQLLVHLFWSKKIAKRPVRSSEPLALPAAHRPGAAEVACACRETEFRFLQLRVLRAVACACTAPTTGGPRQVHESRGMAPTSRGKCTLPLEVKLVPASDRSELFGSFSLV